MIYQMEEVWKGGLPDKGVARLHRLKNEGGVASWVTNMEEVWQAGLLIWRIHKTCFPSSRAEKAEHNTTSYEHNSYLPIFSRPNSACGSGNETANGHHHG